MKVADAAFGHQACGFMCQTMATFPGSCLGVLACVMHDWASSMNLIWTLQQLHEDLANVSSDCKEAMV